MWSWKVPEQLMVCFSTIYISFTNICLQYGGLIFIIIIIFIIMIFITTSVCSLCLLCDPSSSTQPRLVITQVSSSCLYVCVCWCFCVNEEDMSSQWQKNGESCPHCFSGLLVVRFSFLSWGQIRVGLNSGYPAPQSSFTVNLGKSPW